MTNKTLGTLGTTTLTAQQFSPGLTPSDADVAEIANLILNDDDNGNSVGRPIYPGAWARTGLLYIPNRGILKLQVGDWVAVDPASGWPILISRKSLPATLTLTGTTLLNSAIVVVTTSALAAGWRRGMPVTGTNMGAGAKIVNNSPDGLTLTMSVVSTGSASGTTLTASNFTHS